MTDQASWVAVVPVKGGPAAKSRLGDLPGRTRLAEAFAFDTVSALLGATGIRSVYVVTADESVASRMARLGAVIVPESRAEGEPREAPGGRERDLPGARDALNAAVAMGVDAVRLRHPLCPIAVVTGDLPALTAPDVDVALRLAARHPRSLVTDAEGEGTTALFALAGEPVTPRFGPRSRRAHERGGHVLLDLPATATIRRDVDTVASLADALRWGVGPSTSALIAEISPVGAGSGVCGAGRAVPGRGTPEARFAVQ